MSGYIKISEIFYSILGESTYQGLPCVFIRVVGCNLRCSYCDTEYAQTGGKVSDSISDFIESEIRRTSRKTRREYSIKQILSAISQYPVKTIEITGGEPLLQEGVYKLIRELNKKKYKVFVETNGSVDISKLPAKVVIIMDIKCPSSKMRGKMKWANIEKLKVQDEIKFVLSDKKDYLWAKEIIKKYKLSGKKILLSPVFGKLSPKTLSKWILKDGLNARIHLQLHKIIGIR